ncbi:translation initiation factor IF-2, partial [Pseudomonadota bacterium]
SKYDDEEEEGERKKGFAFKKDRSHKRSLKTFLVGNDEEKGLDEKFDFRRVNKGIKSKKEKSKKYEYEKIYQEVEIPEFITVSELAERMNEKKGNVVKKLIGMGVVATVNQTIDADTAELVATEMGHKTNRISESDVENALDMKYSENIEMKEKMPVVTIMGHVDHGKTSLLDAIRSTNVVSGESGGITQHIGASRVILKNGKFITFLDTPGHEAFTEMRLRGAHVTDLVILVVAADDGVKEQTIEAINHAKAANVPIIVAINKIDKPEADPSRVKNELLNHDIVLEEFGGEIMSVEVSAKSKINLDKLEETILLQAEMLDLKAPFDAKAAGAVIESKVDANKGVIATLLVEKGTLKVGDLVLAGTTYGKIRKMVDDTRKSHSRVIPAMAVEILGLDKAPDAGEKFHVIDEEKKAREIIAYRAKKKKDELNKSKAKTLDEMLLSVGGGKKELPIIIKADVHGSVEAIIGSLEKIGTDEVGIRVIHSGAGGISESDVALASASKALIIAFNVRANNQTKEFAKGKGVDIRYHSIIYNVVDEVKAILGGLLEPIKREERLGQAEIRQIFKITGAGKVAGCMVTDGMIQKGSRIRLLRDNVVIYDGKLKTLKRFKDDVKEVKQNFECGLAIEGYDDIKEGDTIECYSIIEEKRKL